VAAGKMATDGHLTPHCALKNPRPSLFQICE